MREELGRSRDSPASKNLCIRLNFCANGYIVRRKNDDVCVIDVCLDLVPYSIYIQELENFFI